MKDTIKQVLIPTTTYATLLTAAQTLNEKIVFPVLNWSWDQASSITPETASIVSEQSDNLEQLLSSSTPAAMAATATTMLLGLGITKSYHEINKRSTKRRDFNAIVAPKEKQTSTLKTWGRRVLQYGALPLTAAAVFFNRDFAQGSLDQIHAGLDYLVNQVGEIPTAVKSALGITAAVATVAAYPVVQRMQTRKKHGPILKQIKVDGYIPITKNMDVHNLRRAEKIPGMSFGEAFQDTSNTEQRVAVITERDYRLSKSERKAKAKDNKRFIIYDKRNDPRQIVDEVVTSALVNDTIGHLAAYAGTVGTEITAATIDQIADKSGLYRGGDNLPVKFNAANIVTVLKGYDWTNPESISDTDVARKAEKLRGVVSPFSVRLERIVGKSNRPVRVGSLAIDRAATMDESRNTNANYPYEGETWPVLRYSAVRNNAGGENGDMDMAHDEMDDHDHDDDNADGHDHDAYVTRGGTSNLVKRHRKKSFDKLNLGEVYTFQVGQESFRIDQNWPKSIPLPGKNNYLRRSYYITDGDQNIVAKLREDATVTKPFGNSDWVIDIYDKKVVDNSGFQIVSELITQFLPRQEQFSDSIRLLEKTHAIPQYTAVDL